MRRRNNLDKMKITESAKRQPACGIGSPQLGIEPSPPVLEGGPGAPKRAAPGRVWEELPGRSRLGSALQPATHKELFLHHPVAPGSLPCRQTVCTSQTLEPAPVAIPFEKSQVERAETLIKSEHLSKAYKI
ncbi:hypothetical protein MG293_003230 [Ovis ammon polii]|uniref:Uncharacterized protein n=1 Tax=Ovis ammon polii TaxID=230172 RepID=A0AAD4UMF2_OVIAM|nr:hypothetical protein MG293_003230 [Ovis ammon polii]